ncbi:MAG: hypothetical protein ACREYF_27770 [Gammaproteobacteria bacterium]
MGILKYEPRAGHDVIEAIDTKMECGCITKPDLLQTAYAQERNDPRQSAVAEVVTGGK